MENTQTIHTREAVCRSASPRLPQLATSLRNLLQTESAPSGMIAGLCSLSDPTTLRQQLRSSLSWLNCMKSKFSAAADAYTSPCPFLATWDEQVACQAYSIQVCDPHSLSGGSCYPANAAFLHSGAEAQLRSGIVTAAISTCSGNPACSGIMVHAKGNGVNGPALVRLFSHATGVIDVALENWATIHQDGHFGPSTGYRVYLKPSSLSWLPASSAALPMATTIDGNLISNGDMASGAFPSLIQRSTSLLGGTVKVVPLVPRLRLHGNYALQFTSGGMNDQIPVPADFSFFPALPGEVVRFRVHCRAVGSPGQAQIYIFRSCGPDCGGGSLDTRPCVTDRWEMLSVELMVSAGESGAMVRIDNDDSGSVLLYDGFELVINTGDGFPGFSDGWHIAGPGVSCNTACESIGHVCTDEQLTLHDSQVHTCEGLSALVEVLPGGRTTAGTCCGVHGPPHAVPHFNTLINDCYHPLNSSVTRSCTSATSVGGAEKNLLCYCHDHPAQPLSPLAWSEEGDSTNCTEDTVNSNLTAAAALMERCLCASGGLNFSEPTYQTLFDAANLSALQAALFGPPGAWSALWSTSGMCSSPCEEALATMLPLWLPAMFGGPPADPTPEGQLLPSYDCHGDPIAMWAIDGSDALSGRTDLTVGRCHEMCAANAEQCAAFTHDLDTNACVWSSEKIPIFSINSRKECHMRGSFVWRLHPGWYCGGEDITFWSDGSHALNGRTDLTADQCKEVCAAHPDLCSGFVHRTADSGCFWQRWSTNALPSTYQSYAHDCYELSLVDFTLKSSTWLHRSAPGGGLRDQLQGSEEYVRYGFWYGGSYLREALQDFRSDEFITLQSAYRVVSANNTENGHRQLLPCLCSMQDTVKSVWQMATETSSQGQALYGMLEEDALPLILSKASGVCSAACELYLVSVMPSVIGELSRSFTADSVLWTTPTIVPPSIQGTWDTWGTRRAWETCVTAYSLSTDGRAQHSSEACGARSAAHFVPVAVPSANETLDIGVCMSSGCHFHGAAAMADGRVIFAPGDAKGVGIFDSATRSTSHVRLGVAWDSETDKFRGAVEVENTGVVVFAPYNADSVGIFDSATNCFSTIDVSQTIVHDHKFSGAASSHGVAVFAPYDAEGVGTLDPTTGIFSFISTYNALEGSAKFWGAAAATNGLVVFAPFEAKGVGVFNAVSGAFSLVDISSDYVLVARAFAGAAAATNGRVIFAPHDADVVGVYVATSSSFSLLDISSTVNSPGKFNGAAAIGSLVVFAPKDAGGLGLFDGMGFWLIGTTGGMDQFAGAAARSNASIGEIVLAPALSADVGLLSWTPTTKASQGVGRVLYASCSEVGSYCYAGVIKESITFQGVIDGQPWSESGTFCSYWFRNASKLVVYHFTLDAGQSIAPCPGWVSEAHFWTTYSVNSEYEAAWEEYECAGTCGGWRCEDIPMQVVDSVRLFSTHESLLLAQQLPTCICSSATLLRDTVLLIINQTQTGQASYSLRDYVATLATPSNMCSSACMPATSVVLSSALRAAAGSVAALFGLNLSSRGVVVELPPAIQGVWQVSSQCGRSYHVAKDGSVVSEVEACAHPAYNASTSVGFSEASSCRDNDRGAQGVLQESYSAVSYADEVASYSWDTESYCTYWFRTSHSLTLFYFLSPMAAEPCPAWESETSFWDTYYYVADAFRYAASMDVYTCDGTACESMSCTDTSASAVSMTSALETLAAELPSCVCAQSSSQLSSLVDDLAQLLASWRCGMGADTASFSYVDVSAASGIARTRHKFNGAAAVRNGQVILAPSMSDGVGIFDPVGSVFSYVDIGVHAGRKFAGAATASGDLVVFAPYDADAVGLFDSTVSAFSHVDISLTISMDAKFGGAAALTSGLVIFSPHNAHGVGVFDAAMRAFWLVNISATIDIDDKFSGAAATDKGLVVFAPLKASGIGMFNPTTSGFWLVDICPASAHAPVPGALNSTFALGCSYRTQPTVRLSLWLRASEISGRVGDEVTTWEDASGEGNDLHLPSPGEAAPCVAPRLNEYIDPSGASHRVVRFADQDGACRSGGCSCLYSDEYVFSSLDNSAGMEFWAVVRATEAGSQTPTYQLKLSQGQCCQDCPFEISRHTVQDVSACEALCTGEISCRFFDFSSYAESCILTSVCQEIAGQSSNYASYRREGPVPSNRTGSLFDFGSFDGSGYGLQYGPQRAEAYVATSAGGGVVSYSKAGSTRGMVVLRMRVEFGSEMRLEMDGTVLARTPITLDGLTATEVNEAATSLGADGPFVLGWRSATGDSQNSWGRSTTWFAGDVMELRIYNGLLSRDEAVALQGQLKAVASGRPLGRFSGAAATGTDRIVFSPLDAAGVGVFDPSTSIFSVLDISATVSSPGKFSSAVTTRAGLVVFAPYDVDGVGIFDPLTSDFSYVDVSVTVQANSKFSGAAVMTNGRVAFAPDSVDGVASVCIPHTSDHRGLPELLQVCQIGSDPSRSPLRLAAHRPVCPFGSFLLSC